MTKVGDKVTLAPLEPKPFDAEAFWAAIDALGNKPFMHQGRGQPAMPPDRVVIEP